MDEPFEGDGVGASESKEAMEYDGYDGYDGEGMGEMGEGGEQLYDDEMQAAE